MSDNAKEFNTTSLSDIKLDVFEGPFDLLLTLLERNKLEIWDVSVSLIADQYIEVLQNNFDMEIASEFLVMATTLLRLKSMRLLPKEERPEEEISEEELIRRLDEYKRYKNIAPIIGDRYDTWNGALYKEQEHLKFKRIYKPTDINQETFYAIYSELAERNKEKINNTKVQMERILKVEKVSIRDKMRQIVSKLITKIKSKFHDIFTPEATKMEKLTGFLAMLELDRRKKVTINQTELFGEIEISQGEEFSLEQSDEVDKEIMKDYSDEE